MACDIEKRIAGVHNLVENVDEEGIHTVYVIGKATLSKVDIIPVNFYVDDDDVEDILAEDDFDEEEAFPESGDVDVKVINKSEKEAVSEETVKSEDGFKLQITLILLRTTQKLLILKKLSSQDKAYEVQG